MLCMEQRRESRFAADQVVPVTILGDSEIHHTGTVKDATGRGLGLEMDFPVSIGSALKIHLSDAVLLGEVIYCYGRNGSFFVGVALEHGLFRLSELTELFRGFNGDLSEQGTGQLVERRRR